MRTKILVADNDPDHLKTIKDFLKGKGYVVIVARGVAAARKVLQKEQIDLAILDVRLTEESDAKDISGLTFARGMDPNIPKIMLTRYPTYTAVREALRSFSGGRPVALGFVSKPEGLPAIQKAVESAVETAFQKLRYEEFFGNLQSGDRNAWRQLWGGEAWRLIALARRHGLSSQEAKDICLESFREVARAKRPPRNMTLKTALVDGALRRIDALGTQKSGKPSLRRRSAETRPSLSPDSEELREDLVAPVVKNKLSQQAMVEQIQKAITELAAKEQKAIVMHLFEGMPVVAIAESLGVKDKTVNNYLRTGIAHLRSKLSELEWRSINDDSTK